MIPAAAVTFTWLSTSTCITNPSVIVLGPGRGIGSTWRWCPRFPIVFWEPFKLQRVATGCLHWEIHHSSGCCSGSSHSPAKLFVATERWVIHTATQPSELNFSWPTMLLHIGKRKRRRKKNKRERERVNKNKRLGKGKSCNQMWLRGLPLVPTQTVTDTHQPLTQLLATKASQHSQDQHASHKQGTRCNNLLTKYSRRERNRPSELHSWPFLCSELAPGFSWWPSACHCCAWGQAGQQLPKVGEK